MAPYNNMEPCFPQLNLIPESQVPNLSTGRQYGAAFYSFPSPWASFPPLTYRVGGQNVLARFET